MASSSQSSPQQTSTTTGSPTAPAASSSTPTTSSNNTSTEPASSAHERFDQTVIYVGDWIGKLDHPDQFHCPSPKHTTDSTQI